MKYTSKFLVTASALLCGLAAVPTAQAHVETVGYTVGSPGDITIYEGTYDHGYNENIGDITIVGIGGTTFASETVNFDTLTGTPASETILQSNLFEGTPVDFQGAAFTGLAAGTYSYVLNTDGALPEWDTSDISPSGTFTISAADGAHGVPDGGLTAMMLGVAVLGLAAIRRRLVCA